jgi:hypothetical protein
MPAAAAAIRIPRTVIATPAPSRIFPVVAGTATAVSNRVSRRQSGRWAQQDQQENAEPEAAQQTPPQQAPAPDMNDKLAQPRDLGELKQQGILTEAEFEAQKSSILSS